jgi:hypothetical protein
MSVGDSGNNLTRSNLRLRNIIIIIANPETIYVCVAYTNVNIIGNSINLEIKSPAISFHYNRLFREGIRRLTHRITQRSAKMRDLKLLIGEKIIILNTHTDYYLVKSKHL